MLPYMTASPFARLGRLAVDLLYPRACALCGRAGAFLCDVCAAGLPRAGPPRCDRCWLPLRLGRCPEDVWHSPSLRRLRSAFRYEGAVRTLVHRFKFGDFSALAEVMATPMAALVDWPADVVVPVPLAPARERERGYNQARLLARGVAAELGLPQAEALARPSSRLAQARTTTAEQRRSNVEGAFRPRPGVAVEGLRVLLVDDVATTGATVAAGAATLAAAGAAEVSAVTFARED
jgi:competence protein ComFC